MTQIVLRLLVAGLLGGLLGYEREQKGKSAGIRTHMLVSIGAALFVLIGVVAQISQQIIISPAPSDRYTRGFLTGRPRVFSLFIALTYAITSPT
ncbi:MgtC/SapB family protein [Aeromonas salmonicida]|uniref:MgtC/SapB family protein n=1 Tax=Aeromonas salmonicida TaxID=645 RepID=UPI001EF4CB42|nr:MgtC/SapB family protein [Aeromonas salmonicida]